jgi:hypothetical protein
VTFCSGLPSSADVCTAPFSLSRYVITAVTSVQDSLHQQMHIQHRSAQLWHLFRTPFISRCMYNTVQHSCDILFRTPFISRCMYSTVQPVTIRHHSCDISLTFRRNTQPNYVVSKNRRSKGPAWQKQRSGCVPCGETGSHTAAGWSLVLLCNLEDGGSVFRRNFDKLLPVDSITFWQPWRWRQCVPPKLR